MMETPGDNEYTNTFDLAKVLLGVLRVEHWHYAGETVY
jgi:hypothetical protein